MGFFHVQNCCTRPVQRRPCPLLWAFLILVVVSLVSHRPLRYHRCVVASVMASVVVVVIRPLARQRDSYQQQRVVPNQGTNSIISPANYCLTLEEFLPELSLDRLLPIFYRNGYQKISDLGRLTNVDMAFLGLQPYEHHKITDASISKIVYLSLAKALFASNASRCTAAA